MYGGGLARANHQPYNPQQQQPNTSFQHKPVQSSEDKTPLHISEMRNNQTSRNEHHTFYNEPKVFYASNSSNSSSRWTSPRPLASMEVSHRPDLDTPSYTRAEVRIHLNSTRQSSPPSQNSGRRETGYHHQRGGGASAEESHRTCPRSEGFLQQYIPSSQEGWRLETCHRPASPEQVHPETPLQDGDSIESPRFITQDDYLTKIDLKDAYLAVPIYPSHRRFLCFRWKGENYQCAALPFGLSSAPRIFTKLLRPVMAKLRSLGVKLMVYIDDILLAAPLVAVANTHTKIALKLLQSLGFVINWKKSSLEPEQTLEYLGLIVDSKQMNCFSPGRKSPK